MNKNQRKSKITEPEIEKFQSEIKSNTKWKNNLQEQQRRTSWKSEQVRTKKIKKTREKKKGIEILHERSNHGRRGEAGRERHPCGGSKSAPLSTSRSSRRRDTSSNRNRTRDQPSFRPNLERRRGRRWRKTP